MFSKREMEGYLEIDHRDSPGITPEQAAKAGKNVIPVGAGQRYQSATITCSNCERIVVLNPNRSRDRYWCSQCDAFHCDECAKATRITGVCKTMKQRINELLAKAANCRIF